ncbi:preprotein translocase subunit YajC [Leptospira kanakyensis]|uniref:Sec translocon accessory complex subunit YajC n=1 Tax=Leptospira kanakyensis TaxID=2484968 RepID=A0A6N4QLH2_9LEPT|nr:preprotein translocase subunit YajC [Leptospira kanakyensis]MCW7481499.1 preprotein translocase subunit YajC [Leptospira kanakyensis]TGK53956.1 preprotein translocase subunit YajC [Leptospira kanakyensis]TGK57751.1 preprotein translocase subunit YajC [Leptospira kanakyensis]TGK73460.1 preprotein translocase subunit YajC [Leptospira kanakyensis]
MLNFNFLTPEILILAQEEGAKSSLQSLIIIPIMLVAMYFLVILPNKKEEKKRKEMITNLQKGDNVVTNSGLHGKIVEFKDNNETVVLSVAANTNITFETSAILKKKV